MPPRRNQLELHTVATTRPTWTESTEPHLSPITFSYRRVVAAIREHGLVAAGGPGDGLGDLHVPGIDHGSDRAEALTHVAADPSGQ